MNRRIITCSAPTSDMDLHFDKLLINFETNDLMIFQDLIIQLRETQVSKYIVRDTPMLVCIYKGVEDIIKSLG